MTPADIVRRLQIIEPLIRRRRGASHAELMAAASVSAKQLQALLDALEAGGANVQSESGIVRSRQRQPVFTATLVQSTGPKRKTSAAVKHQDERGRPRLIGPPGREPLRRKLRRK